MSQVRVRVGVGSVLQFLGPETATPELGAEVKGNVCPAWTGPLQGPNSPSEDGNLPYQASCRVRIAIVGQNGAKLGKSQGSQPESGPCSGRMRAGQTFPQSISGRDRGGTGPYVWLLPGDDGPGDVEGHSGGVGGGDGAPDPQPPQAEGRTQQCRERRAVRAGDPFARRGGPGAIEGW